MHSCLPQSVCVVATDSAYFPLQLAHTDRQTVTSLCSSPSAVLNTTAYPDPESCLLRLQAYTAPMVYRPVESSP